MLLTIPPGQPVADILPPILMTIGIVILGWLLLTTIRGKIQRRQAEQPTTRERIDDIKSTRHTDPAEEHLAGLLTIAQRLATQLDNKAARLEQLIDLADERIALISAELHETSDYDGYVDPPARPAPAHVNWTPADDAAAHAEGAAGVATMPANASATDPLARTVYELADSGQSPVQIARTLGEHTGKVELILALRQ